MLSESHDKNHRQQGTTRSQLGEEGLVVSDAVANALIILHRAARTMTTEAVVERLEATVAVLCDEPVSCAEVIEVISALNVVRTSHQDGRVDRAVVSATRRAVAAYLGGHLEAESRDKGTALASLLGGLQIDERYTSSIYSWVAVVAILESGEMPLSSAEEEIVFREVAVRDAVLEFGYPLIGSARSLGALGRQRLELENLYAIAAPIERSRSFECPPGLKLTREFARCWLRGARLSPNFTLPPHVLLESPAEVYLLRFLCEEFHRCWLTEAEFTRVWSKDLVRDAAKAFYRSIALGDVDEEALYEAASAAYGFVLNAVLRNEVQRGQSALEELAVAHKFLRDRFHLGYPLRVSGIPLKSGGPGLVEWSVSAPSDSSNQGASHGLSISLTEEGGGNAITVRFTNRDSGEGEEDWADLRAVVDRRALSFFPFAVPAMRQVLQREAIGVPCDSLWRAEAVRAGLACSDALSWQRRVPVTSDELAKVLALLVNLEEALRYVTEQFPQQWGCAE